MKPGSTLIVLLALASGPAAQASYSYYGNGCGPTLLVHGTPRLGHTFFLETESSFSSYQGQAACLPFAYHAAYLLTGVSNSAWGPLTLPHALGYLGPGWCGAMLASPDVVLDVPLTWGNVGPPIRIPFVVPNLPGLVGAEFYQQVFAIDGCYDPCYGPGPRRFSVSRGGHGIIGI